MTRKTARKTTHAASPNSRYDTLWLECSNCGGVVQENWISCPYCAALFEVNDGKTEM